MEDLWVSSMTRGPLGQVGHRHDKEGAQGGSEGSSGALKVLTTDPSLQSGLSRHSGVLTSRLANLPGRSSPGKGPAKYLAWTGGGGCAVQALLVEVYRGSY